MKATNKEQVILAAWEAEAFKAGIKIQKTILADPQPLSSGDQVYTWPDKHHPKYSYVNDRILKESKGREGPFMFLDNHVNIIMPMYFYAKVGDILFCKEHKIHLEVTEESKVYRIVKHMEPISNGTDDLKMVGFTDQDALNEGIAALYPYSNVGDDFFYLPDQIMAASALDCFKHHWNSQPANKDYPFEKNPFVITLGLKFVQ